MRVRELLYGKHDPYANLESRPIDNGNWDDHSEALRYAITTVNIKRQCRLVIEVGSWKGASAMYFASCLKDEYEPEIVCVDTWLGSIEHRDNMLAKGEFNHGRPWLYETFLSNIVRAGLQNVITPFPIDSINAAYWFWRKNIRADLIYIDAGHEYESVYADIRMYKELLHSGGVMLVDDAHYEPIQRAAKVLLPEATTIDGIARDGTVGFLNYIWQKP